MTTWDTDRQEFTPQTGAPSVVDIKWDLRRALRQLQAMGYDTTKRAGYSVYVYKIGGA